MDGYELTDFEWNVIQPLLPNKPRGVPRVDGRHVATRYEKHASNYLATIKPACVKNWMRVYESMA